MSGRHVGSGDDVPVLDAPPPALDLATEPEPAPLTPRAITASVATVVTSILVAVAAVVPLPYAINIPGPTTDTLGEQRGVPLITITGAETYESTGSLLLTTVKVAGGPGSPVGLANVIGSWFEPTNTVAPVETVYAPTETREEISDRNQAAMVSSQENATVAALEELGYTVPTTLEVVEVMEGSGADGHIRAEDVIVSVAGTALTSFSDLSERLDEVEPGTPLVVGVERAGERVDVEVTPGANPEGKAQLGVFIDPVFDLPVDVRITIDQVGGPSAGTMFALGVIDRLTEADETGGKTIAGTGTIDLAGKVGAIGGIRQKLAGAVDDGATWFLAPEANCAEVVGHVPDGLQVVSVGTLHEAREAVTAIGADRTADLPTC